MTTPTPTLSMAIATAFAIAAVAIPVTPAAAAINVRDSARATQPTPIERIIAQERGRHGDPRIFGLSERAPAQIVQVPDGFDWGDAGIGGAATLALVLLMAGGAALRHESRRQEAHG
jgi:hypothetical protein